MILCFKLDFVLCISELIFQKLLLLFMMQRRISTLSGKFEPIPLCLLVQWYKSNESNELKKKMKIWCICNSPACLNHSFFLSSNVTDVNRRP